MTNEAVNPLKIASSRGRLIASRARQMAQLGDSIAAISDHSAVTSEEWEMYSKHLRNFLTELQEDVEVFDMKISFSG